VFAVRLCILSTIIAVSRDAFAHVKSGRTRLLTSIIRNWGTPVLKSSPLRSVPMDELVDLVSLLVVFCFLVDSAQWLSLCCQVVTIPFLIGLLVDCLLILPFVDNEVPVLDFSCTWFLGLQLLKFWTKLVSSNLFLLLSWSCSLKLLDRQNCFLTCKVVLANYACYYYLIGQ